MIKRTDPEMIYLDPSFVTESYEQITGDEVPIQISRSCDTVGELSIGFAKAGATTKVEKQYPVSIRRMYEKLAPRMNSFPTVNLEATSVTELPEVFWLDGILGTCRSHLSRGTEEVGGSAYFAFSSSLDNAARRNMPLLTNDAYFSTGYDQLSQHAFSITCDFCVCARVLVKLLYLDHKNPIGVLLVGFKTGYI